MDTGMLTQGLMMLLRWLHFFFGIMWIGHLYYFNFTQMSIMGKVDTPTKAGITRFLLPEAMYWFRWGAMWTFATGLLYYLYSGHQMGAGFMQSGYGVTITVGAVFGITMWANVWFVIWPKQKLVIANAEQVAGGGAALPGVAEAAAGARLASRSNTLFSIPMLFYMGSASHLQPVVTDSSNMAGFWICFGLLWAALEFNALNGKTGPFDTVKGVIHSGFALSVLIFVMMKVFVG